MNPDNTLSDQICKTYEATRKGLACIAIAFPLLLQAIISQYFMRWILPLVRYRRQRFICSHRVALPTKSSFV